MAPVVRGIAAVAPREIMGRLVRSVGGDEGGAAALKKRLKLNNKAAPDVIDTMFEWGAERERRGDSPRKNNRYKRF